MMSQNPEWLDRLEMFKLLRSKAEPGQCCVGPSFSFFSFRQRPRSHISGQRWVCTVAATKAGDNVGEKEASSSIEKWEPCVMCYI